MIKCGFAFCCCSRFRCAARWLVPVCVVLAIYLEACKPMMTPGAVSAKLLMVPFDPENFAILPPWGEIIEGRPYIRKKLPSVGILPVW